MQIKGDNSCLEDKTAKYIDVKSTVDIQQEQKKKTIPSHVGGLFPSPDYESGWFEIGLNKIYVTGATDGQIPDSSSSNVYKTAAKVVGISDLGFNLSDVPRYVQITAGPAGTTGISRLDNTADSWITAIDLTAERWYASTNTDDRIIGLRIFYPASNRLAIATSEETLMYHRYETSSGATQDFQLTSLAINIKLWK